MQRSLLLDICSRPYAALCHINSLRMVELASQIHQQLRPFALNLGVSTWSAGCAWNAQYNRPVALLHKPLVHLRIFHSDKREYDLSSMSFENFGIHLMVSNLVHDLLVLISFDSLLALIPSLPLHQTRQLANVRCGSSSAQLRI